MARCIALAVVAAVAAPSLLPACETPVYRYAMYRWEPSAYEVYHFHRGELEPGLRAVGERLAAAEGDEIAPANVAFYPVNLDEDPELKTVPRDVQRIWRAKEDEGAQAPLTVIVNPMGLEVFSGELAEEHIEGLLDTPLRKEIGRHLEQGHAGVYLLVLGKDDKLNKAAEEAVNKLVENVNAGKLQLYSGPDPYDPLGPARPPAEDQPAGGEKDAKDAKDEQSPPHTVAMMKLARGEAESKDAWLYRSLMAVEGDLYELQDEPMLFVVYGRGRVLPPYIGKGIVYDNLVDVTDFITSACSCTVKEQNPGVDLLMAYDWEAASAAVAEKFGSEEGNKESLADLFPQLIVPDDAASAEPESGDLAAADGDETGATEPADAAASPGPADADADTRADADAADTGNNAPAVVAAVPADRSSSEDGAPAAAGSGFLMTLGIGLGVALIALLAATFLILKPQ